MSGSKNNSSKTRKIQCGQWRLTARRTVPSWFEDGAFGLLLQIWRQSRTFYVVTHRCYRPTILLIGPERGWNTNGFALKNETQKWPVMSCHLSNVDSCIYQLMWPLCPDLTVGHKWLASLSFWHTGYWHMSNDSFLTTRHLFLSNCWNGVQQSLFSF